MPGSDLTSVLLPHLPGLHLLLDDDLVQLYLQLHQAQVRGWPVTDCYRQKGSDIRLSPQLSPHQPAVGLGDVLGEERDGETEVSEGGEEVGEAGQDGAQTAQSVVSPPQHPDQELSYWPPSAVLPAARPLSP